MTIAPLEELRALGERSRALQAELDSIREKIGPLVADAIRGGVLDVDIMEASGIRSRDTIRAIRDKHGIPPRPRGRRKR